MFVRHRKCLRASTNFLGDTLNTQLSKRRRAPCSRPVHLSESSCLHFLRRSICPVSQILWPKTLRFRFWLVGQGNLGDCLHCVAELVSEVLGANSAICCITVEVTSRVAWPGDDPAKTGRQESINLARSPVDFGHRCHTFPSILRKGESKMTETSSMILLRPLGSLTLQGHQYNDEVNRKVNAKALSKGLEITDTICAEVF